MKFSVIYEELKFSDVFASASPEEVETRKEQWQLQKLIDVVDSIKDKTKLPDGSWHIHDDIELNHYELTSLQGLQGLNVSIVDNDFKCYYNQLENLKGGPKEVRGSYMCFKNYLTSLEGAPKVVGEDFNCDNNQIITLKGGPEEIEGDFICYQNRITSLEGSPKKIGGSFKLAFNKLTSLQGAPIEIGNNFCIAENKLTSLEGCPKEVGGYFNCTKNSRKFTIDEVRAVCNVQGDIIV